MRNTEVLVIATDKDMIKQVFQAICDDILEENEDVLFGFLPIDDQLQVNLYGFVWRDKSESYQWEKLCRKVLGILVLYQWQENRSVDLLRQALGFFETNFEIPMLTASIINSNSEKLPVKLYRGGLPVTTECRFTFYDPTSPESIRELIVGLININLELISRD